MKTILWVIALATGIFTSGASSAATVFADGKNWRQLTETTGFSFDAVANHCPIGGGACTGVFDGWTWATVTEVQSLFESYNIGFIVNGGTSDFEAPDNDNPWATAFLTDFNRTGGAPGNFPFVSGWTAIEIDSTFSYFGEVSDSFLNDLGDRMRTARSPRTAGFPLRGVWLYETQPTVIDIDGDGAADSLDNCIAVANPQQRDSNADGFGNFCDADLNDDCIVNAVDLGLFRLVFFSADADADLNGDGVVNVGDLGLLRLQFFQEPGPSAVASCP